MTRLRPLPPDQLDGEQRRVYDAITTGPRASALQVVPLTDQSGALRGPFGPMLLSPPVGEALQALGSALRSGTVLSARIRELAVLAVAQHWDSDFERYAHELLARSIGLADEQLAALRSGQVPAELSPDEVTGLELARALLRGNAPEHLYDDCVTALGERAVFELSTLVGYYAGLALQLRLFDIGV